VKSLTTARERFDPEEIRRIIELGKQRGMIHGPGDKAVIDKAALDAEKMPSVIWGWIDVTPAMAAKWLRNNFGNRPVRQDTVRAYARDMLNKVWVPTHQGIAFNDEDVLIDGQHRLKAVVLSGCTIRFMVTFGLPSQIAGHEMTTMDAVDRGNTRSVADQLVIQHGFKHGSKTAQLSAALASLCCGERTRRLSVGQTLEVYRAFEKSASYVIEHRSKETGIRAAGVMAGFAFALATELLPFGLYAGWDKETPISTMFKALITCEGLKEGTPMHQLRRFLTSDESKLFTPTLNRGLAELTLQAIYLEQQGKSGKELEAALDGANHFRSLQSERIGKIAKIFKLPEPPKPSVKAAEATDSDVEAAAPIVAKSSGRPTMDRIIHVAETTTGIARFILIGRGTDIEIEIARAVMMPPTPMCSFRTQATRSWWRFVEPRVCSTL
jgi:hypothetical protein